MPAEPGSSGKHQKISSVTISFGDADMLGGCPCLASYEENIKELVGAYEVQQKDGRAFVHVHKRNSSNRDLRAVQELATSKAVRSISLRGDGKVEGHTDAYIGVAADSAVTTSARLAEGIREANCRTCKYVEKAVGKEFRRLHWNSSQVRFEQHM